MRTGRPKAPLVLLMEERETLESWSHRSRSAPALARRARVILACATGLDNMTVARRTPLCRIPYFARSVTTDERRNSCAPAARSGR